ncbi:Kunitz/Bovine pancreatic trypsin inhibitor domain protein [Cooperia oncophora]
MEVLFESERSGNESLCAQPKQSGDCTSTIRRYWYNAVTRQCEVFHYTGCHGNDNNFQSLVACQQQCKGITVHRNSDRPDVKRKKHLTTSKNNRVIAEPKCPQGRAYRDQHGKFLRCSAQTRCPANFVCSYDGVAHGCCPTKAFTCSLAADKGVKCGLGRTYRYFFNAAKQSCETFQYEGCDGNSNNFLSAQHCEQYCGVGGSYSSEHFSLEILADRPNAAIPPLQEAEIDSVPLVCTGSKDCPSTHECIAVPSKGNVAYRCCPTKGCELGEIVLKDPGTLQPLRCNSDLRNSCPANYRCRFSSLLTYSVCCGSSANGFCPADERPYMVSVDETVKECSMNIPGSCPTQFLCRFNLQRNKYYCCAPNPESEFTHLRAI